MMPIQGVYLEQFIDRSIVEKWNNATLADNFIFYKVLTSHPDICRRMVEVLLDKEIDSISYVGGEEVLDVSSSSKGIRLDIYVRNKDEVYDVELQIRDTRNLPRRSRYYQGIMDVDSLDRGQNYGTLRESYVIFICFTDIFGNDRPVYEFQNISVDDHSIKLNDGTHKIFFNAKKYASMSTGRQRSFFEYLCGMPATGEFEKEIEDIVSHIKQKPEWRMQYMTWEMEMKERYSDGLKDGFEQGHREGIENRARETACNLLKLNLLSYDQIAQATGLSIEEIEELASQVY